MAVDDSAPRAAAALLDGRQRATMIAAMAPCQPDALLAASIGHARAHGIELTILFGDVAGRCAFVREHDHDLLESGQLRLICLAGGVPRRLGPHVGFFPNGLYDLDRWIADGTVAVDIAVAQVTAATGGFDLGDMIGYTPAALERAGCAGFEVLSGTPGRTGGWVIPADRPDAVCAVAAPAQRAGSPAGFPAGSAERERIGKLVAELVPDDATLEIGIGAVPETVVPYLSRKTRLGLHSGLLPASLRAPILAGAFGGAAKSYARGRHVATGVLGGGADWGDRLQLEPISVTHAPGVLAQQHRFWAVNSALEVDLLGQVNAEYAAGVRVGSAGGQADFFRAAHLSAGGAAVLAIPARTRFGQARIVARIGPPHGVCTAAADLDIVVTEYGYVQLSGSTATERASRMISIAHPDDRAALRREWDNGG